MPFCSHCGSRIDYSSKYCSECGKPLSQAENEQQKQKAVFEGEIHKCPCCGEIIDYFMANCPSCGFELRNRELLNSVKSFFESVEQATSNDQKVFLIRNFPIPNTKEDVLEFLMLSSANISGETSREQLDAWVAKFHQCYQKAKLLFDDNNELNQINDIYEKTNKMIKKAKLSQKSKVAWKAFLKLKVIIPNPIVGAVVLLLVALEVYSLISWGFEGTNIVFCVIIWALTYWFTENRSRNKENKNARKNNNQQTETAVKKIKFPSSVSNSTMEHYVKVELQLEQAGFKNIKTVPLNDLTFGILKKQGSVESITVNGKSIDSYNIKRFYPDIPIVIIYHNIK